MVKKQISMKKHRTIKKRGENGWKQKLKNDAVGRKKVGVMRGRGAKSN